MKSAELDDLIVFDVGLGFETLKRLIPFGAFRSAQGGRLQRIRVLAALTEVLLGRVFRVSAEQNVGTAAGHVGGYGNGTFAPGLGNNQRLTRVVLGVQDFMNDARPLEDARELF